jgi:hypothetical protein
LYRSTVRYPKRHSSANATAVIETHLAEVLMLFLCMLGL